MAKETKNKTKINPVAAGIAGTAMVAAGVAAVALSNKENRKKAGRVLKDLKSKGNKLTKQAAKGIEKVVKNEELLRSTAQTAASTVKKVKDSIKEKQKAQLVRKNLQKGKVSRVFI
jgi:carboxylesterase type B